MKVEKTVIWALVILAGSAAAGQAQEAGGFDSQGLAPLAVQSADWAGFYLGAQAGYGWTQATAFGRDMDIDGGTLGLLAGYNFQSGNVVFGVENDFNYNPVEDDDTAYRWDASARGRIGYSMDRTLLFATGGIAFGSGDLEASGISTDDLLIGWTAGVGIEYALTDHVSLRGEYRYSDFGEDDLGGALGDVSVTQQKAFIGASYGF